MNGMAARLFSLAIALVFMAASDIALAEPCQINTEAVKQAVLEVAKTLGEHGIDYVRGKLYKRMTKQSAELIWSISLTIPGHG